MILRIDIPVDLWKKDELVSSSRNGPCKFGKEGKSVVYGRGISRQRGATGKCSTLLGAQRSKNGSRRWRVSYGRGGTELLGSTEEVKALSLDDWSPDSASELMA